MVLEGASTSPTDAFRDDSSPTSDADPYSSSPTADSYGSSQRIQVDLSKLPRPIPILAPFLGFSQTRLAKATGDSLAETQKLVQRPLTQDEINAVSYHGAKGFAISSYYFPLGIGGSYWRYSNTKSTFRFPFWQPNLEKFNPEKLGPLKGAQARSAWHSLRLLSYATVGNWVAKLLVGTYAATVATTGMRLDPRMKDIVETIRKIGNEEANRRQRAPPPAAPNAGVIGGERSMGQETLPADGTAMGRSLEDRDRLSGSNTGVLSDQQMQSQEMRQQADFARSSVQNQAATYQKDTPSPQSTAFDMDDVAPASGNESVDPGAGAQSAWERLRRGGASASSQRRDDRSSASSPRAGGDAWGGKWRGGGAPVEQGERETYGDNTNFSRNDEEKQRAREQAQREFDARLERERQGGDVEENRKWR